jgi:hypothetical protein
MQSMNAWEIHSTTQIVGGNQLNEAYTSQGATQSRFVGPLVVFAGAQGDLIGNITGHSHLRR